MTAADLTVLIDFHSWARDRVLDVMEVLPALPDLESIRRTWAEHEVKVRVFITALTDADADRVVEFRRPDGTAGAFPLAHIVQHLVNHGTYHRGQLTMMLRQLGAQPPDGTDLIRYYRDRATATAV